MFFMYIMSAGGHGWCILGDRPIFYASILHALGVFCPRQSLGQFKVRMLPLVFVLQPHLLFGKKKEAKFNYSFGYLISLISVFSVINESMCFAL